MWENSPTSLLGASQPTQGAEWSPGNFQEVGRPLSDVGEFSHVTFWQPVNFPRHVLATSTFPTSLFGGQHISHVTFWQPAHFPRHLLAASKFPTSPSGSQKNYLGACSKVDNR